MAATSITPDQFASITFDYIIVGGGAAGLVVAGRLSEDTDVQVGVLEAGGDHSDNPLVKIPGMALSLQDHPDLDWSFQTQPQAGTHNRRHIWPRGKGLGGSAMMNTMMYSNCSKRDLDAWEALGNEGWNWESMQPYYRKVEAYTSPTEDVAREIGSINIDPSIRGKTGPIKTSFASSSSGWLETTWAETSINAGHQPPTDPRSGINLGSATQLLTIDPESKERSYSYTGYIKPNLNRTNLKILTNAHAGRIMLEDQNGLAKAVGVIYYVNGQAYEVKARLEVICSAGTIQTPQLLELSGIGDTEVLERAQIQTRVALATVGTNLQDHPLIALTYQAKDDIPTAETMKNNPAIGAQAMEAYNINKTGPLTSGLAAVGFSSFHTVCPDLDNAQVNELVESAREYKSTATEKQLLIQEAQLRDRNEALIQWIAAPVGAAFSKVDQGLSKALEHGYPGGFCSILAVTTHLFSRGNVHISSPDPLARPAIDPNYLSHPLDIELMARAVLHARKLMHTEPLRSKLKATPNGDLIPIGGHGSSIDDPKTIEEAKEFVKWNLITCYHPIGTASMLPRAEGGVVDRELKVYGTSNVRVIDASIFPLHVQGNIMSLVYAVAERGSDIIKAGRKAQ